MTGEPAAPRPPAERCEPPLRLQSVSGYHWIINPGQRGRYIPAFWNHHEQCWRPGTPGKKLTPEDVAHIWIYSHPCDPAAIVPDPEDANQIKTAVMAHCAATFTGEHFVCACANAGKLINGCDTILGAKMAKVLAALRDAARGAGG